MSTKQAVKFILDKHGWSKYKLAKELGRRPIMINNYLKHTKMGVATAALFEEKFGIEISDAYNPGA